MLMSMAKPVMLMQIGTMVNIKRCLVASEQKATNMLNANAAAHGGTECS